MNSQLASVLLGDDDDDDEVETKQQPATRGLLEAALLGDDDDDDDAADDNVDIETLASHSRLGQGQTVIPSTAAAGARMPQQQQHTARHPQASVFPSTAMPQHGQHSSFPQAQQQAHPLSVPMMNTQQPHTHQPGRAHIPSANQTPGQDPKSKPSIPINKALQIAFQYVKTHGSPGQQDSIKKLLTEMQAMKSNNLDNGQLYKFLTNGLKTILGNDLYQKIMEDSIKKAQNPQSSANRPQNTGPGNGQPSRPQGSTAQLPGAPRPQQQPRAPFPHQMTNQAQRQFNTPPNNQQMRGKPSGPTTLQQQQQQQQRGMPLNTGMRPGSGHNMYQQQQQRSNMQGNVMRPQGGYQQSHWQSDPKGRPMPVNQRFQMHQPGMSNLPQHLVKRPGRQFENEEKLNTDYVVVDTNAETVRGLEDNLKDADEKDVVNIEQEELAALKLAPSEGMSGDEPRATPTVREITLTKYNNMGLKLKADNTHKVVLVQEVLPNAPEEICTKLYPGDLILGVNGMDGENLRTVEVIVEALLRGIPDGSTVKVKIQRGTSLPPPNWNEASSEQARMMNSQAQRGGRSSNNAAIDLTGDQAYSGASSSQSSGRYMGYGTGTNLKVPGPINPEYHQHSRQIMTQREEWHKFNIATPGYVWRKLQAAMSPVRAPQDSKHNAKQLVFRIREEEAPSNPLCKVLSESVQLYMKNVVESLIEISKQRRNMSAHSLLAKKSSDFSGGRDVSRNLEVSCTQDPRHILYGLSRDHSTRYKNKIQELYPKLEKEVEEADEANRKSRNKNKAEDWLETASKLAAEGQMSVKDVAELRFKRHIAEKDASHKRARQYTSHTSDIWGQTNFNHNIFLRPNMQDHWHGSHTLCQQRNQCPLGQYPPDKLQKVDVVHFLRQSKASAHHSHIYLRAVSGASLKTDDLAIHR